MCAKNDIDITKVFSEYLFWDVKMENLDIDRDKYLIIPRALYATTKDTFEGDIQRLEKLYSKEEILWHLKNTTEAISNTVCELTAKRYNAKPFFRFKI